MYLHGRNIVGGEPSGAGASTFAAVNAETGEALEPMFFEATAEEIDLAAARAAGAWGRFRNQPPEKIADFLCQIAAEIMWLDQKLIVCAHQETALPEARLIAERARTVNQLKLFADLVREGSWVEATIDRAIVDRKPLPKPDVRRMLQSVGPVAIFSASNFPFAFSVAGGDTAAALAAGNPVVVKAHPGHPGTSEMVGRIIVSAAEATGMPAGVFSLLQGVGHEVGLQLVQHPAIKSVAFTGSQRAGRALFDAATTRPEPIPVHAEMGSTNPIFLFPGALQKNGAAIAEGLVQSVVLGVGQFCTNPGLVFGLESDELTAFIEKAGDCALRVKAGSMLYQGICDRYQSSLKTFQYIPGLRLVGSGIAPGDAQAQAAVLTCDVRTYLRHDLLREEHFGPCTIIVSCKSEAMMEEIVRRLDGQLTATIHGTAADVEQYRGLTDLLRQKAGRLVFNQFPTGVEVCAAMHHGGPYPATTDSRFTSVGGAAIKRFARPVCFQNAPEALLPPELKNSNPRNIWRLIDNQFTRNNIEP